MVVVCPSSEKTKEVINNYLEVFQIEESYIGVSNVPKSNSLSPPIASSALADPHPTIRTSFSFTMVAAAFSFVYATMSDVRD